MVGVAQDRDYEGQPDEEWAAEALRNYRANNDSIIDDHFQVVTPAFPRTLEPYPAPRPSRPILTPSSATLKHLLPAFAVLTLI